MAPPPLLNWRIIDRKNLTHDVFELKLERPKTSSGEEVKFQAGQYMSIVVPGAGPGGRNLRRAYSIASAPEVKEVELCIKLVEGGPGTNYLNGVKAGNEIQAQAPFGDFVIDHDQTLPALFIGTGTGLAPLRSMILSREWVSKAPIGFLLGVREERDIIYPELFIEDRPAPLRSHEHVQIALSRPSGQAQGNVPGWRGFKGRVTDYIRQMKWDFARTHYYLCGTGAMIAEVKEFLTVSHGVSKEQIHTEKYY